MLCEHCHKREATVHLNADDAEATSPGPAHLCEECARIPRPITDAEVNQLLNLEASGVAMPPDFFTRVAEDLKRRAAHHGSAMSPELQSFVSRHRSPR